MCLLSVLLQIKPTQTHTWKERKTQISTCQEHSCPLTCSGPHDQTDRVHLCRRESTGRAPCSEWVIETLPISLSPSPLTVFPQWKSGSLYLSMFAICFYLCEQSVGLDSLGLCTPTPHTSSRSGMPAMLRCISTLMPQLVKKHRYTSLFGPVWDIMFVFWLHNMFWP